MLAIASVTRSREVYLTHAEIDGSLTMKADKAMTMGAAIPRPESVAVDFCSRCSERVLAASHSCSIRCSNFGRIVPFRSEEHTSELQSLMRISYAVFCLKKKTMRYIIHTHSTTTKTHTT